MHHGDGVEEAFYLSNRVFTLSFHRFGDFFPGTGSIVDFGEDEGKHYTMNVPLKKGIDDESYLRIFKKVTKCLSRLLLMLLNTIDLVSLFSSPELTHSLLISLVIFV